MTGILSAQADELRARSEALMQKAYNLFCQSWNERIGGYSDTAAKTLPTCLGSVMNPHICGQLPRRSAGRLPSKVILREERASLSVIVS